MVKGYELRAWDERDVWLTETYEATIEPPMAEGWGRIAGVPILLFTSVEMDERKKFVKVAEDIGRGLIYVGVADVENPVDSVVWTQMTGIRGDLALIRPFPTPKYDYLPKVVDIVRKHIWEGAPPPVPVERLFEETWEGGKSRESPATLKELSREVVEGVVMMTRGASEEEIEGLLRESERRAGELYNAFVRALAREEPIGDVKRKAKEVLRQYIIWRELLRRLGRLPPKKPISTEDVLALIYEMSPIKEFKYGIPLRDRAIRYDKLEKRLRELGHDVEDIADVLIRLQEEGKLYWHRPEDWIELTEEGFKQAKGLPKPPTRPPPEEFTTEEPPKELFVLILTPTVGRGDRPEEAREIYVALKPHMLKIYRVSELPRGFKFKGWNALTYEHDGKEWIIKRVFLAKKGDYWYEVSPTLHGVWRWKRVEPEKIIEEEKACTGPEYRDVEELWNRAKPERRAEWLRRIGEDREWVIELDSHLDWEMLSAWQRKQLVPLLREEMKRAPPKKPLEKPTPPPEELERKVKELEGRVLELLDILDDARKRGLARIDHDLLQSWWSWAWRLQDARREKTKPLEELLEEWQRLERTIMEECKDIIGRPVREEDIIRAVEELYDKYGRAVSWETLKWELFKRRICPVGAAELAEKLVEEGKLEKETYGWVPPKEKRWVIISKPPERPKPVRLSFDEIWERITPLAPPQLDLWRGKDRYWRELYERWHEWTEEQRRRVVSSLRDLNEVERGVLFVLCPHAKRVWEERIAPTPVPPRPPETPEVVRVAEEAIRFLEGL
ncbi:hypothetical protein DRN94_004340 [archaeon]|nr:hypothetical protein [archaeon]